MKYRLIADGRDCYFNRIHPSRRLRNAIFTIWEGDEAPTNGDAYASLFEAEAHGFIFPAVKAYQGRKFLRDFKATELNKLIKWRITNK